MGFAESDSAAALQKTGGDVDAATNLLLDGFGTTRIGNAESIQSVESAKDASPPQDGLKPLSSADFSGDEGCNGDGIPGGTLTPSERAMLEGGCGDVSTLLAGIDAGARRQLAADCRRACERVGGQDFATLTMARVCSVLRLDPQGFCTFAGSTAPVHATPVHVMSAPIVPQLADTELCWPALLTLLSLFSDNGSYDARSRAVLRHLSLSYSVAWAKLRVAEIGRLQQLVRQQQQQQQPQQETLPAGDVSSRMNSDGPVEAPMGSSRALKVGGAAAVGGALLFVTAGLAAPMVAAAVGAVGAGGALTAVGGTAFVSTLFGVGGAGLGGFTAAKRTRGLSEFVFRPLMKGMKVPGEPGYYVAPSDGSSLSAVETAVEWRLEWMWAGAGLFSASFFTKAAKKNPMRWSSGSAAEIAQQLRAKADVDPQVAGKALLLRTKRRGGSANNGESGVVPASLLAGGAAVAVWKAVDSEAGAEFASPMEAVAWIENQLMPPTAIAAARGEARQTEPEPEAEPEPELEPSSGLTVAIGVSGWLADNTKDSVQRHWRWLADDSALNGAELHTLLWEGDLLLSLGGFISNTLQGMVQTQVGKGVVGAVTSTAAVAAFAAPMTVAGGAKLLTNPWVMALDRADKAGTVLAEVLLARTHGQRPVILLGWSTGARLIFACLEALAKHGGEAAAGIVDSAFLLGTPVDAAPARWEAVKRVVSWRLVNGYSASDKVLSLARALAVSKGTMTCAAGLAGLRPVSHPCVENIDVSSWLSTAASKQASLTPSMEHTQYRARARDIFCAMGVGE